MQNCLTYFDGLITLRDRKRRIYSKIRILGLRGATYVSAFGENGKCDKFALVTLRSSEVPIMIDLSRFPSDIWTGNVTQINRAKLSNKTRRYSAKIEVASAEISCAGKADARLTEILNDSV